jgi:hypothetical protein
MDTDRLRQLVDHPPREPERASDHAFTAAVMARLDPPQSAPQMRRFAWCAAAGVAVAAAFLPIDSLPAIDGLSDWLDGELLLELGAAALIAAIVLVIAHHRSAPRRISA